MKVSQTKDQWFNHVKSFWCVAAAVGISSHHTGELLVASEGQHRKPRPLIPLQHIIRSKRGHFAHCNATALRWFCLSAGGTARERSRHVNVSISVACISYRRMLTTIKQNQSTSWHTSPPPVVSSSWDGNLPLEIKTPPALLCAQRATTVAVIMTGLSFNNSRNYMIYCFICIINYVNY